MATTARWYSTTLMRFVSNDPMLYAAGDNDLYRFVGNSPTNRVDPSGLEDQTGFIQIAYLPTEFSDKNIKIDDQVTRDVQRIIDAAAATYGSSGSKIRVSFFAAASQNVFDSQSKGPVKTETSYTSGFTLAHCYAGTVNLIGRCAPWNWNRSMYEDCPVETKNKSLIIKMIARGPAPGNSAETFGQGEDYGITLFSYGLDGVFDALGIKKEQEKQLLISWTIAHEIIHAIGGGHADADGFIDSASASRESLGKAVYSEKAAKLLLESLHIPLK